jgi:hypothetical protein
MLDFILSVALIAGAYIGSVIFAIALFRLFFPLKSKSVENKLTLTYSRNKMSNSTVKNKIHWLPENGRRDWVKVNS